MADNGTPKLDMGAYIARLELEGAPKPDSGWLRRIHEAHLRAIPFENLDVLAGRPIILDPVALFDKLVTRRRGGFCFEMNGLFSVVLSAIGVPYRNLLARVWYRGGQAPRPKTHQVILAEADGVTWLADVGFGGPGFRHPIPFETDAISDQIDGRYRLVDDIDFGFMLERANRDGDWERLYSFDLAPAWPADFDLGSHFAATHPSSIFTQARIITRATEDGRIILRDNELTIASHDGTDKHIVNDNKIEAVLAELFGLMVRD